MLGGIVSAMGHVGRFAKRAGIGAAAGGALGLMNTGDLGGMAGGAAMGAAAAGIGIPAVSRMASNRGLSFAGAAGSGLGFLGRGAAKMRGAGIGMMGRGGRIGSNVGLGMSAAGRLGVSGATAGISALGRPGVSIAVNKWGGRGLAAMGVGSAAYIGSSVIGSNRGYSGSAGLMGGSLPQMGKLPTIEDRIK